MADGSTRANTTTNVTTDTTTKAIKMYTTFFVLFNSLTPFPSVIAQDVDASILFVSPTLLSSITVMQKVEKVALFRFS
jgi:hypothetical protein